MEMKALTRCAFFVLAMGIAAGPALGAEDDSHSGTRSHHRGYKVGGGVVVLVVIAAVAASMVLFGDLRRRRYARKEPTAPRPAPLPEGPDWDAHDAEDAGADQPRLPSPRQRKARRAEEVTAQPGSDL